MEHHSSDGKLWEDLLLLFSCSVMADSAASWTAACQASLSFTISRFLKLISTESVMPSNHLVLCLPLFLLSSVFPSVRVFSNELALYIRLPHFGASASASVLPMNIQSWFPLGLMILSLNNIFILFNLFIYLFICSEFCHTLKWKGLGFTCLPHPDPPSHLPPQGLMILISLQSQELSRVLSSTTVWKHQFKTSIHECWKNHSFGYRDFSLQSDVSVF